LEPVRVHRETPFLNPTALQDGTMQTCKIGTSARQPAASFDAGQPDAGALRIRPATTR
jgi:hypothetical protein